jgi:LAO/AO transport system kinase
VGDLHGTDALDALAAEVVAGTRDPYTAADDLVATLTA